MALKFLLAHEPACGFAAYGSNARVAKTDEELEDRHQSLFGDADSADDIKITMPSSDNANGQHVNGEAGSNGQIPTQMHNGTDEPNPPNVSLSISPYTRLFTCFGPDKK